MSERITTRFKATLIAFSILLSSAIIGYMPAFGIDPLGLMLTVIIQNLIIIAFAAALFGWNGNRK